MNGELMRKKWEEVVANDLLGPTIVSPFIRYFT